jgi:hypothetical protein
MLYGTGYQRIGLGQAFIQFILDSALTQPTGRLYASTGELDLWGMPLEGGEAEFIFENDTLFASTLRLYRGLEKLDTRGFITLSDPVHIMLDTLTAWRNTEILAGGRIEAVRMGEEVILSPAEVSIAGGRIGIEGDWSNVDNFNLSVQTDQVDLVRMLRFFGKPPRFRGLVTGRSMASSRDGRLALDGVLEASTGEIDRIPYTALSSEFSLRDNHLTLKQLDLSHDKGHAAVTGVLTYAQSESGFGRLGGLDSLDLRGAFDLYKFHDLQPHLPWRFETHGALLGTFTAQGPAEDPVYTADLNARNPRFDRLTGDLLTGRLRYSNERLEFIDLALKTRVGSYSGGGTIPANLNPGAGRLDVIRDAPVDLRFQGTSTQFEFLTPYFDDIDSLNGEFDIELAITGTFERLLRNGRLYTKDGTVELFIMENPIRSVEGEVVFGTMDMTRFFKPAFNLEIHGEHAYFAQPLRELEGVGSASFTVTGRDTVYFRGDFVPDPGEAYFRRDFTAPEDYALKKVDTGTIIVYDIHVPFYSGAMVQNGEVNAEIEGEITLTKVGSEDWRYAGNIDIVEGDFIYNQNEFIIEDGWVTLDPSEFNPRYYIQAVTPVELPSSGEDQETLEFVDVTVIFTGTLKEPEPPTFIDLPVQYTESDFYELLALGSPAEIIDPAATAGMSLTNAILRRFEENARQVSGFDRFQIQTASARSTIPGPGEVRFHIGKRLSPRLYVGVQADPTLSFNQYQIAYRLNRNISLVGSVDEQGLYQAKFRLKIRY